MCRNIKKLYFYDNKSLKLPVHITTFFFIIITYLQLD